MLKNIIIAYLFLFQRKLPKIQELRFIKSSKMVALVFCGTFFLYVAQAKCPILKNQLQSSPNFTLFSKFILHQFKPMDQTVRSPFFGLIGDSRKTYLRSSISTTECLFGVNIYFLNIFEFTDYNNETNKFKLKYHKEEKYFCNTNKRLSEIYLVDFDEKLFASFYACEIIRINNQFIKFEGVLIYVMYHNVNLTTSSEAFSKLQLTYEILEKEAKIPRNSLITVKRKFLKYPPKNSCQDLTVPPKCAKVEDDKHETITKNYLVFALILSAFCAIIVFFGACVQKYSFFV